MRSSSMVFASWSNHFLSAEEMLSFHDSLEVNASFWVLTFFENLSRPFLRIVRGFGGFGAMLKVGFQ